MDRADPGAHADDVPPICAALREAMRSLGLTQRQVGDAIGENQQTVSTWVNGREPRLDDIARLERALRPDLLAGWLLRAAGYVHDANTTEEAIRRTPDLTPQSIEAVTGLLRSLRASG